MIPTPKRFPRFGVAVAAILLAGAALRAQCPPFAPSNPPQATAWPVDSTVDFPRNGTGKFEKLSVQAATYAPSWSPWTMDLLLFATTVVQGTTVTTVRGSGIAKNGAALLGTSAAAPEGERVCFLRGTGRARCTVAFTAGTYRLRFQAAQRTQGGVADAQQVRVTAGGQTVLEFTPTAAFAEYVTDVFRVPVDANVLVSFDGLVGVLDHVALIDDVRRQEVLPWTDDASWNTGLAPTAADHVLIPSGAAVIMDGACVAKTVEVQGLLLADDQPLVSLTTDWLLVHTPGSALRVGTEQQPFAGDFTLTLTAVDDGTDILGVGNKFLAARDGGLVDLHGQPRVAWTRLADLSGNVLTLDEDVDWQDGDELIVTRTRHMANGALQQPDSESEVCRIDAVLAADQVQVSVLVNGLWTTQFAHAHNDAAPFGRPAAAPQWTVDERAEVGLLSHNVRVVGDQASSNTKFGAHVMMMGCSSCPGGGFGRIEGVELRRVGQRQKLGRYPMHWHMQAGNGDGQYFVGSSVRESYNRAVTIHGTHRVLVADNVCYDHEGHGIFFEDGVEMENQVLRNLVVFTRKPAAGEQMLAHDNSHDQPQNRSPAAFWISHPNNVISGNVAADCVGTGYWFALHLAPTGVSAMPQWAAEFGGIVAKNAALGAFDDNVAHAVKNGIDLNDSVDANGTQDCSLDDTLKTNIGWNPPAVTFLNRFRAFGCATALYSGTGGDEIVFDDCVLSDNEWHVQFASGFTLQDSLLVENTLTGVFLPTHPSFSGSAFVVYDGPGRMIDCHLDGFDHLIGWNSTVVSSVFGAAQRHTNHRLEGLTFESGVPGYVRFQDFAAAPHGPDDVSSMADPRHWGIAVRVDSSVGGIAPPTGADYTMVTNHPMMLFGTGGAHPDLDMGTLKGWPDVWYSPRRWGHLRLLHFQTSGGILPPPQQPDVLFTRWDFDGYPGVSFLSDWHVDADRQLPVVSRRAADVGAEECWYTVEWTPPANTNLLRVVVGELEPGDVTTLHLLNLNGWSNETVSVGGQVLTPMDNPQVLFGQPSTAYARTHGQSLWLRVVQVNEQDSVVITW